MITLVCPSHGTHEINQYFTTWFEYVDQLGQSSVVTGRGRLSSKTFANLLKGDIHGSAS